MTVEIRAIDPRDQAALRAWWEVGRDATAERPVDGWPAWEISRQGLPVRRTDGRLVLVGAHEGDRTVGAGMVFLFGRDNLHLGEVDVYVAPPQRRRGVGRSLLAELERLAAADGRTTLISTAYAPVDAESPGSLFAAALGYPVASAEETKTVDLTTAPQGWGPLDDAVAAALDGYRLEVFDGPVSEEHLADFCVLLSALLGEVPTGDLDLEPQTWTPERVREFEQRAVRIGMVPVTSVAIDPDGRLCGMSDVRVNRHDPRHASVGTTMVQPGHRGHRLGLGMKLASHRRLLELFPECRYVETGNAGTNAPMNAVNTQMGYRVVERALDVQKRL